MLLLVRCAWIEGGVLASAGYSDTDSSSFSSSGKASGSDGLSEEAKLYSRDRYGSGKSATGDRTAQGIASPQSQTAIPPTDVSTADVTPDEIYPEIARLRRKRRRIRRTVIAIVCVIVALLGIGAAYAGWYVNELDSALAPDEQTNSELQKVLIPETAGKPYYILVLGSDSREGNYSAHIDQRNGNERSDVMMLVRIDSKNKKVTLLSIPRDTPYQLSDGSYVKINEMFNNFGSAGAVKAVSSLTGLPISHVAEVRISGLEAIVDLLGGITVDVPTQLSYTTTDQEEITIEAGRQTLNGREAQIFARARHEFEGNQDEHRQDNVRQLLKAIIDKILDHPVSEIPNIVLQLAQYVDTDLKTLNVVSLALDFSGSNITLYSGTGPTEGDINPGTGNKWMCFLNPEGWDLAAKTVDAGKDPHGLDYTETQVLWADVPDQPDFRTSLAHKYYYGG